MYWLNRSRTWFAVFCLAMLLVACCGSTASHLIEPAAHICWRRSKIRSIIAKPVLNELLFTLQLVLCAIEIQHTGLPCLFSSWVYAPPPSCLSSESNKHDIVLQMIVSLQKAQCESKLQTTTKSAFGLDQTTRPADFSGVNCANSTSKISGWFLSYVCYFSYHIKRKKWWTASISTLLFPNTSCYFVHVTE